MDEIRFLCPTGAIGGGVELASFREGMSLNPHFVASDAGTIDAGPFALGSGRGAYAREAVYDDLDILLSEVPKGVPIITGSAATAGGDPHVEWTLDIVREIVRKRGLKLRVAAIHAEQSKEYLTEMLTKGRIKALDNAPHFDADTITRSTRIVGMMGTEPLIEALEQDVDLIIAGRCSDSALFSAYPIMRGMPEGISWHAGKVVECGTLACETFRRGSMFGRVSKEGAVITPIGPGLRCTPQSIAAHSLYENGDPYLHRECSGTLDISEAQFEQVDEASVRITGAAFQHADAYSVKLEGVELLGYQSVIVGGIRDPLIIRQLDNWLAEVKDAIETKVAKLLGSQLARKDWRIDVHVYGRNGVMGVKEPLMRELPHEVGLVVMLTAPTQELATTIAELSRQPLLHHPIPEWSGSITGFACLFNQAHVERGPVWRFCVNHVVLPERRDDTYRTKILELS